MTDYTKLTESKLLSEMDLITSELERRLEQDRKEAQEAEESQKLLYRVIGWKQPEEKIPEINDLDKWKLYWIEHEVRVEEFCISTWWCPEDERKLLDVVDTCGHRDGSIFWDGLSFEEFCTELEDLLK